MAISIIERFPEVKDANQLRVLAGILRYGVTDESQAERFVRQHVAFAINKLRSHGATIKAVCGDEMLQRILAVECRFPCSVYSSDVRREVYDTIEDFVRLYEAIYGRS